MKHLSLSHTLNAFEYKFRQLSTRDGTLLQPNKVNLFLQVIDVRDRKDLGILLEDVDGVNGLVTDLKVVKQACSWSCKRHQLYGRSMKDQLDEEIQRRNGQKLR